MESLSLVVLLLVGAALATRDCPTLSHPIDCPRRNNYDFPLSPEALLISEHPVSVSSPTGANVSFNCSLSNQRHVENGSLVNYTILWRYNGSYRWPYPDHWSVRSDSWAHSTLTVTNVTTLDSGYYECMVRDGPVFGTQEYVSVTVSKRAWLNKPITGQVGEVPRLEVSHKELDTPVDMFGTVFTDSSCQRSGEDQSVYWYKDGEDITSSSYDPSTGVLTYINNSGLLHGVYQCFVESSAGSDYYNVRVLPAYFADPPSNFSCVAVDRENDPQRVKLILSWEAPLLVAGGDSSQRYYIIQVLTNCYNTSQSTCAEIPLTRDYDIRCSVYLNTVDPVGDTIVPPGGGIAAVDNFNTARQRRYNTPRNLSVECNSTHSTATLADTQIDPYVFLTSVNLQAVCLHQGLVHSESLVLDEDSYFDESSYSLSVRSQDPERVCVFAGNYSYLHFPSDVVLSVEGVSCAVRPATLLLHCSPSSLTWGGSLPTNLTGLCYTPHLHKVMIGPVTLRPGDMYLHSDLLPVGSVCTYTSDNVSVQCVISDSPPTTSDTPTQGDSTPPPTTSDTPTQDTVCPAGGVQSLVYLWVALALVGSSLLLVSSIMLLSCLLLYYQRHKQTQAKEQMHILASIVERQLDSSEIKDSENKGDSKEYPQSYTNRP